MPPAARAQRVVTLPPEVTGAAAIAWAGAARRAGAELLELRTDLHDEATADAPGLSTVLPVLAAQRAGREIPAAWRRAARQLDVELGVTSPVIPTLVSHHAAAPMSPEEAVARWRPARLPEGALVKHVEPLGRPSEGPRLLATQRRLGELYGAARVTVLATGACALPFRAVLAERNALDYLAIGSAWQAAPGQRLLADAVRAARGERGTLRLGILGSGISGSRSPRIHPQPFDRIDLPEDAPLAELLPALWPHYRGFSVTSPFKRAAANAVGASLPAINTLVRRPGGWDWANTDVDGAREVLDRLPRPLTALGDGGATEALRLAARELGLPLQVVRRAEVSGPIRGGVVWTWPAHVSPPARLEFEAATVAVIAYGAPARKLRQEILARGGRPMMLGATWFVAQARGQRARWEHAS